MSKSEQEALKKFREFRSKHIAHSVNEFEENIVVAYYNDERVMEEGIHNIEIQHHRVVGLSLPDIQEIERLSMKILKFIKDEIQSESTKILNIVRKLSIEEVLKHGTKVPSMSRVDKRRK